MSQICTQDEPMSETDFQLEMLNQLRDLAVGQSTIATDMATVKEHLVKLNGSVAGHEKRLGELAAMTAASVADRLLNASTAAAAATAVMTAHVLGCPLKARMDAVEDWVTGMQAVTVSNKHWLDRIWPVIYAASGIAVYMLAMHTDQLLKAMSSK